MEDLEIIEQQEESVAHVSVLDLPMARIQIVQASDVIKDDTEGLSREMLEPKLTQNADGLWLLVLRRQGAHRSFTVPYVGAEIMLADAEIGMVVVLVGYHGASAEKYGKLGYLVQKGQFYRYYQQEVSGEWKQVQWAQLNDETRQMVLDLPKPEWARSPGKLSSERKPPAKRVETTGYKVVRLIDGRYYSLYDPNFEYILGERVKQPAKPGHGGGYYSYPTNEAGIKFLESCTQKIPFHALIKTPALALLECEIGGRILDYGHKFASTYLRPVRVLEVRHRE